MTGALFDLARARALGHGPARHGAPGDARRARADRHRRGRRHRRRGRRGARDAARPDRRRRPRPRRALPRHRPVSRKEPSDETPSRFVSSPCWRLRSPSGSASPCRALRRLVPGRPGAGRRGQGLPRRPAAARDPGRTRRSRTTRSPGSTTSVSQPASPASSARCSSSRSPSGSPGSCTGAGCDGRESSAAEPVVSGLCEHRPGRIGLAGNPASPIHRLDPRTKIVGLLGTTIVAVTAPLSALARLRRLRARPAAVVAAGARVAARTIWRRARVVLPLILFVAVFVPFVRKGGEEYALGPLTVSAAGLQPFATVSPRRRSAPSARSCSARRRPSRTSCAGSSACACRACSR